MKHLTTVLFLVAALLFSMVPASATVPIFHGIASRNRAGVCNLSLDFGAKGDDSTDDSGAWNAAISAWQAGTCNTIVLDSGKTYLINEAIAIPYTANGSYPYQNPLRITSDGSQANGYASSVLGNGSGALDLRYTGADGLHPCKIDTRGAGNLEIDHITLEDNGTDDFCFLQTTNTTLNIHDDMIIGDQSEGGTSNHQDAFRLGGTGYWANSVNTTNGSTTLTIGGGDPPFTSSMVGYTITYGTKSNGAWSAHYTTTIASYVSPTQVTLTNAATATISGGSANYFGVGSDSHAPFQGYVSTFTHNAYSYIRRGIIWENYANTVFVHDEYFYYTSGCSASDIPDCAPYYFDIDGSPNIGNTIDNIDVEMTHYPYAVAFMGEDELANTVKYGAIGDPSSTMLGAIFYGGTTAQNMITMGYYAPQQSTGTINTKISSGFSSGSQTVTPASMAGITTSTAVLVDPDSSGLQEWVTPSATTGTTFTATFAHAHGSNVRVLGAAPFVSGVNYTSNNFFSNGNLNVPNHFYSALDTLSIVNSVPTISMNDGTNSGTVLNDDGSGTIVMSPLATGHNIVLENAARNQFNMILYDAGNVTFHGTVSAGAHLLCSSGSGTPCENSGSCSLSSATSCTITYTVPASSICTVTAGNGDTTTGTETFKASLSTNTLTVTANVGSSQTATVVGNLTCL